MLTLHPSCFAAAFLSTSNVPKYTALAGVLRKMVAAKPCFTANRAERQAQNGAHVQPMGCCNSG